MDGLVYGDVGAGVVDAGPVPPERGRQPGDLPTAAVHSRDRLLRRMRREAVQEVPQPTSREVLRDVRARHGGVAAIGFPDRCCRIWATLQWYLK